MRIFRRGIGPVFLAVAVGAVSSLVAVGQLAVAAPGRTNAGASGNPSFASSPPDRAVYGPRASRAASSAVPSNLVGDVFITDPSISSASAGGTEPSIAVNPSNPTQIAITRFTFLWNGNADMLYSTDGGNTWTNEATIPAPPGVAGTAGCPCDQTLDYGRDGTLYGTFLTTSHVATGSTTDPTSAAAWQWNGNPAQVTDKAGTSPDQPWLLVNRDPTTASQDNAYVAYDDFNGSPDARVAVSYGASPVNITTDNKAGTESPLATNPGLRLAKDPSNGWMYALYEQSSGASQPKSVTYKLNRSEDGGATWTLNGSSDGLTVDTVNSDQAPGFKFGSVNALLGGVDHVAVDPTSHDVYVVYGQDVSGGNQIKIRQLTDNGSGGLNVGAAYTVSTSTDAALPSVAVLANGTVGVLYISHDGTAVDGHPAFSAHFARSTDGGATWNDVTLQSSFESPATDNGDPRQRVFGDYDQLKAVGDSFYGVYSGNRNGFGSGTSAIDPIFFSATPASLAITKTADAASVGAGSQIGFNVTLTNSAAGPAAGIGVSDNLPAGNGVDWSVDAGNSDSGWSVSGSPPNQSLVYSPTTLGGDSSTHVHVVSATTGNSCGAYDNTASFTSTNGGSGQDSASETVNCGWITVVKHLVPTYDPGRFNLKIDGTTHASNVGNNGTTGQVTVSTGNHTVAETAGTSTNLSLYVPRIECTDGSASYGTSLSGIHVGLGDNVTCTITNTRRLRKV
jgi:uncharacterized repeat protein (TIGR01451 family)